MKVLILGFGSIGRRHARNLQAISADMQLVIADPVLPDVQEFGGRVTVYSDWRTMLADHRDATAAVIASPTDAHLTQLEMLVVQGIPAYVEKPVCLASEVADFERVMHFAAQEGQRHAVGFQYRFHPAVQELETLLRHMLGPKLHLVFMGKDDLLARYGPDVGGVMAAHPIDTALRWFGPAKCIELVTDGAYITGRIVHRGEHESIYSYRMDGGPRRSAIGGADWSVDLPPDDDMYLDAMRAWLNWVVGWERDPRMATLADGLAVSQVLAQVRRV